MSARRLTALAVKLAEIRRVVILALMDNQRASDPLVYSLSPPAAKQLAEPLEQAVENYLHSFPDTE